MNEMPKFRFWCQKVLPLVYDDSLSYYEVLCKVVDYINKLIDQDVIFGEELASLQSDLAEVQDWIDNFDTTTVPEIINDYLDSMNIYTPVNTVTAISRKKVIFLGDSYGPQSDWPTYAAQCLSLSNTQYWDASDNGGRFSDDTYRLFLQRWMNDYAEEAPNVKTIVIVGGINDCNEEKYAQLATCFGNLRTYVDTYFGADVKIYVGFIGWSLDTSSILHGRTAIWRRAVQEFYSRCSEWDMIYLPGMEGVIHNRSFLSSDGLHPNATGGQRIGECVANALQCGNCSVTYSSEGTGVCTPLDGDTSTIEGSIKQVLFGGQVCTYLVNFRISGASIEFANGAWKDVCKCELPFSNGMGVIKIPCVIRDSSNTTNMNANIDFQVYNDVLQARLYEVTDLGGFVAVTADRIYSMYGCTSIPVIND